MISGVGICGPRPLLLLFIISLSCCASSIYAARRHRDKVSPVVVIGTVYCDTCFQQSFSRDSHYISGAMVAVECGLESTGPAFYQEVETNNKGMFRVVLPFSVTKQVKQIKGCFVKLLKSGEPYCPVASTSNSSSIRFKERKKGKHIFSAGFFTFKPIKQPGLCNQQPDLKLNSFPSFLPNPEIPTLPNPLIPIGINLPSIPTLPNLPQLPPLPPLPPLPKLPYLNVIPQQPSGKSQVKNEEVSQDQFFYSPTPLDVPPKMVHTPPLVLDPSQSLPSFVPNPSQVPLPLVPNPFLPPSPPALPPPALLFPSLPNLIPGLTVASPPPPPPPPSSLASFPLPPTSFSPESGIPSPPSLFSPEKVKP